MALTLQDFFSGLAGKDLEATQLKRAQVEAANMALADAKAAKEGEQATASKIASMFAPQGNAEEQGGLIGLGGTPDMLPSIGQTFGGQPQPAMGGGMMGGQPQKSAVQTLQEQVAQNNAVIQSLSKSSNIYDQRAAEKYKAENAKILEKMPEMQSKELDTRLKSEQAMYNSIAGIVDDQSLNLRMAQASPEERAMIAKNYGIIPNFGTGMYSFNTPEVQTLIKGAKQQAMTQVQRTEQEKRLADIRNQEAQRILEERRDAETKRNNIAVQAGLRERMRVDQNIAGTNLSAGTAARGAELRKEQRDALKPIEPLVNNLSKIKTFLETSNTAADRQLNAALTDLDGNVRATNLLFQDNKNFGSLGGKVAGFVSQAFTGRYTAEQRKQIRELVDGLEKEATTVRSSVNSYYKDLAKVTGVPEALVKTPNFYGGNSAQAEADAFLSSMGAPKP